MEDFCSIGVVGGAEVFLHPALVANLNGIISISVIVGYGGCTWAGLGNCHILGRHQHQQFTIVAAGTILGISTHVAKRGRRIVGNCVFENLRRDGVGVVGDVPIVVEVGRVSAPLKTDPQSVVVTCRHQVAGEIDLVGSFALQDAAGRHDR